MIIKIFMYKSEIFYSFAIAARQYAYVSITCV